MGIWDGGHILKTCCRIYGIGPDRTGATLIPIISAHVAPGPEIWNDQSAPYHNVGAIPGVTAHQLDTVCYR